VPKEVKRFINHNENIWNKWIVNKPKSVILLDSAPIFSWMIASSYFTNILVRKHNSIIKTFSFKGYQSRLLKKIRSSFNCNKHIYIELNKNQKIKVKKLCKEAKTIIKNKKDLYELNFLGIWLGIDIYETYLKDGKPTIDFMDPKLWSKVNEGIELLVFWVDYFDNNLVSGLVFSHDCYNQLNIPAKVAYKNNVPVYLPNVIGGQLSDKPHAIYKYRFCNYRKMFNVLSHKEKNEGIKWAKSQLENRLSGIVGVDMSYSTASAFTFNENSKPVLRKSDKIKVLICTHCFYDNPHGYGGMIFLDFYEWITYLGKISEKTNYDWYIKPHPDYLPGTLETINKIISKYKKITLIPPETSFHQLSREGLSFALTCFGSIGHELPLLGIKVINAAYNPHSAYDFTWNCKSIDEYENLLLNLDKLDKEIDPQQIYEFYFINNNYTVVDDFIFSSHRQMLKELSFDIQNSTAVFDYFLNQLTDIKHQEIISKMEGFIDSGKPNYFRNGPE